VIGVLHVGSLTARHFSDQERGLLQLAADRAAIAIEHSRLHAQRHIVEAMQRAMLPSALPMIPGILLTARYLPAAVDARVGGDWYDVFELGRGRIALVIGDVVGRGVEAGALTIEVGDGSLARLGAEALVGDRTAEDARHARAGLIEQRAIFDVLVANGDDQEVGVELVEGKVCGRDVKHGWQRASDGG